MTATVCRAERVARMRLAALHPDWAQAFLPDWLWDQWGWARIFAECELESVTPMRFQR